MSNQNSDNVYRGGTYQGGVYRGGSYENGEDKEKKDPNTPQQESSPPSQEQKSGRHASPPVDDESSGTMKLQRPRAGGGGVPSAPTAGGPVSGGSPVSGRPPASPPTSAPPAASPPNPQSPQPPQSPQARPGTPTQYGSPQGAAAPTSSPPRSAPPAASAAPSAPPQSPTQGSPQGRPPGAPPGGPQSGPRPPQTGSPQRPQVPGGGVVATPGAPGQQSYGQQGPGHHPSSSPPDMAATQHNPAGAPPQTPSQPTSAPPSQPTSAPPSSAPVSSQPVSGSAQSVAPVSGQPHSAQPYSAQPYSAQPYSGQPYSGAFAPSASPVSGQPNSGAPTSGLFGTNQASALGSAEGTVYGLPVTEQAISTAIAAGKPVDKLRPQPQLPTSRALELMTSTSPPAGLVMGRDAEQEPVVAPFFRPEPTKVAMIGGVYLARLLVFRALALGARVAVCTVRPQEWNGLGEAATGRNDRLAVLQGDRPVTVEASQHSPALYVYDVGERGTTTSPVLGPWRTQLTVLPRLTNYGDSSTSGAYMTVIQRLTQEEAGAARQLLRVNSEVLQWLQMLHDDMIALLRTGASERYIWAAPTSTESHMFGQAMRTY